MPSSVARAMCAAVVPRVSPRIAPRARGSQYGAPRPASAGTKYTPSLAGTRAAQTESTALGAALLAGLAVGLWKGEREAADLWRAERTFAPDPAADREALLSGWRAAVACVRDLAGRTT